MDVDDGGRDRFPFIATEMKKPTIAPAKRVSRA